MDVKQREELLRAYAAGRVSWSALQRKGFDNYLQVLAGLGELNLRPPIAPMEGPNVEARQRGRAMLRAALEKVTR